MQKETRSKETVHPTHGFSLQLDVVALRHTNILIIRHVFVGVSSCASVRVKVSVEWAEVCVCAHGLLCRVSDSSSVSGAHLPLFPFATKIAIPSTDMCEICETKRSSTLTLTLVLTLLLLRKLQFWCYCCVENVDRTTSVAIFAATP